MAPLRDVFANLADRRGLRFPGPLEATVELPALHWGLTPFDRIAMLADPGLRIEDAPMLRRIELLRAAGQLRYRIGADDGEELGVLASVRDAVALARAVLIDGRPIAELEVPRRGPTFPSLGPPFEQ